MPTDALLHFHQVLAPALDLANRKLVSELERRCSVLVGVGEGSYPIELRRFHELTQLTELRFRLSRKAHDERSSQSHFRDGAAHLLNRLQKDIGAPSAFHPFQHPGRSVLKRNINVGTDLFVGSN